MTAYLLLGLGFALWLLAAYLLAKIVSGADTHRSVWIRLLVGAAVGVVTAVAGSVAFMHSDVASVFGAQTDSGRNTSSLLARAIQAVLFSIAGALALGVTSLRFAVRAMSGPRQPLATGDPPLDAAVDVLVAAEFELPDGPAFEFDRKPVAFLAHPSGTRVVLVRGRTMFDRLRCEVLTLFTDGTGVVSVNSRHGVPRGGHYMLGATPLELFDAHRVLVEERVAAGAVVDTDFSLERWQRSTREVLIASLADHPWRASALHILSSFSLPARSPSPDRSW